MTKLVDELLYKGIFYHKLSSKWASASVFVPKQGSAQWKFTVDLSPVKKYTIPYQVPMPKVEQELINNSGAQFYANLDFTQSYLQLLMHK